jgi:hypothetical protein
VNKEKLLTLTNDAISVGSGFRPESTTANLTFVMDRPNLMNEIKALLK